MNKLVLFLLTAAVWAQAPVPRLVTKDGRHALLVDGAPYLMLGVQVHNSSAWPAFLDKVWPAAEKLHANTVIAPVYWEQWEPEPGRYDTTAVDALLREARVHKMRLVLLWFGTWKNGSAHYVPLWLKTGPRRYTRVTTKSSGVVDSPSPHDAALLEADKKAFAAFMSHLKAADAQRTVIMVQVQNEAGTYGSVRDYSAAAQKLFDGAVPDELVKAMGKGPGTWAQVFGADADEYFHGWSIARYIGAVAAAGKAVYPLPMYTNAALRDPLNPGPASSYESGGPTDNQIVVYRTAAPALDLVAPDIYMIDDVRYRKVLDLYARRDNPLLVPESANTEAGAKYFFEALGRGAVGWAPFGMDFTGYTNAPLGAAELNAALLEEYAMNYRLLGPMMREAAKLSFEGKLKALAETKGRGGETLDFGAWQAVVSFGVPMFGFGNHPPGNARANGRVLAAQLGPDEFLVAGCFARVDFQPAAGGRRELLRVEELRYENGVGRPVRIWNGDQTDWGLNFTAAPQVLRVRVGTY